ncbi:hypothetical protein [Verrucomicrobium spinosum]|uniref:hypothetical protein n=1 Tax=Verrucomicrobium spinosum TaxID=2736 RepID=UPI000B22DD90|nr:hypothetical protein [Verrucomicrobium spinosum]
MGAPHGSQSYWRSSFRCQLRSSSSWLADFARHLADYNRPITYAPYWYRDYYSKYPGALFKPGWTPKGVLEDIVYWTKNPHRDSHKWGQPGFHPDGFVSHHCFAGTSDSAMWVMGMAGSLLPLTAMKC